MPRRSDRNLSFGRLTEISAQTLLDHMSDPRVVAHLPLLNTAWDRDDVAKFVASKEAYWARDGLGHWAIFRGETYLGWGGFQKEGEDWDFGLVLRSGSFGDGPEIVRTALSYARNDPRIARVTFLLPPSRKRVGALARIGAKRVGQVDYDGTAFIKFALDTD